MCSPNCSMGTGHHLTGAANNRLSLPHRRYSVPETVMRKYSLSRQKSAESTESGVATVPTPSVPSAGIDSHKKPAQDMTPKRDTLNKACQTSPRSSLVSSMSLSSSYKSATKKHWDHKKKANSLDETTSTSKETEDSQLYFDSNYKDFEKYKTEILREVSLPGEIIVEKEETSTSILIAKSDEVKDEDETVEEVVDQLNENTNNYVIEEDIKLLLENITKDMTIKLLLGFRTKSFPETEKNTLEKCKTKRDTKSANGRLFKNEFSLKETGFGSSENNENGDSTLSNMKDITQFEDTPSPQDQESPPQDFSPPKSGHSSDQSAECYITDCDICTAEGRKCCSLDNSSEVFSFTSPDMVMTTNELKTSSEFTSTSCTLDQTVTERSTSTQDSTLSITSITPESYNSSSTETKLKLINQDRISPSSVGLVINSETTILDPIRTKESTRNLSFNLSESSESSERMKKIPTQSLVITSECIVTEPIQCDNANMHYVLEMMETDSAFTEGSEHTQVIEYSTNQTTQETNIMVTDEITNEQFNVTEEDKEEKMYDSLEITHENEEKGSNKLKVLNIFLDRNIGYRQSIGSGFPEENELQDSFAKRSMSCGELPPGIEDESETPVNGTVPTKSNTETRETQTSKTEGEEILEEEEDLLKELGFKEELKSGRTSSSFLELCGKKSELSYEEMCKKQVQDMFYGNRTYEVITSNSNNNNNNNEPTRRNLMGNVMSTSEDSLKSYALSKKPPQRQDAEINGSNVSFCTSTMTNTMENDGRLSGYTISQQEMICDGNCNTETDETGCGNVIMLRIPLPTGDDGNPIPTCIEGPEIENQGKELIIPRYSAMPRTVSMLVNTSSADYSSDSELSLADSLEDVTSSEQVNTSEQGWPNKHDDRMVRGDVISLLPENNKKLKREQSNEAYAYFVSLSGEMGEIKSETIPEPLKKKLMKRDSEVRRHLDHYHHHPRRKERKSESLFKKTLKKKAPPLSQSDFYDSSSKEDVGRLRKAYSLTSGDSEERLVKQDSKSTQWEEFPQSFEQKENEKVEVVDEESIIKQRKASKWLRCAQLLRNDPELDKVVSEVLLTAVLKDKDEMDLDEKIKNILLEALKEDEESKSEKTDSNGEQVVPTVRKVKAPLIEESVESNKDSNGNEVTIYKSTSVQTTESSLHTTTCDSFEFCDLCHENNLKEDKFYENGSKNEDNSKEGMINGISKGDIGKYDNLISNNLKSDFKDKLDSASSKNQQQSLEINIPTSQKKIINQMKSDKPKVDHTKHKASHALSDKPKIASSKSPRSHSCLNNKQPSRIHTMKIPPRRSANTLGVKFQQRFEAIPEEKSGSMESSEDQQKSPKPSSLRRSSVPSDVLLLGRDNTSKRVQKLHDINCGNVSDERLQDITESTNITHEQGRRHTIHGNLRELHDDEQQRERNDQNRRHTVHGNINVSSGQIPGLRRVNLNVGSIMRGRVIGQRGNVMIGRFRPVNEETQVEKDENEQILIGEIERIRRKMYDGKETLETTKPEEQEELMTLSKGWINFYLLRESMDFGSDQSIDDGGSIHSPTMEETTGRVPTSLRTVNVVGKSEDQVRQYTVQISASEESTSSHNIISEKEERLPGLNKLNKRSPRSSSESSEINLPGIPAPSPVTSPTSTKSQSPTFSEISNQQSETLPKLHSNKRSILSNTTNSKIKSSAKKYVTSKKEQKELSICTSTTSEQGYDYLRLPSPQSEIQSRSPTTPGPELSPTTASSSTCDSRSESPVLPSIKWPMRQVQRRNINRYNRIDTGRQQTHIPVHPNAQNSGTCWTVTVAGNSGNPQQPPPDVEMRLSFPSNQQQQQQPHQQPVQHQQQTPRPEYVAVPNNNNLLHNHMVRETKERRLRRALQDPSPTPPQPCWSLTVKNRNQGEEKEERRSHHEKSSKRLTKKGYQYEGEERSEEEKRQFSFIWPKVEEILDHGPIRKPRINSVQWNSSNIQELSVTGLAITPEKKPRVPTMSERDITRVHYSRTKLY